VAAASASTATTAANCPKISIRTRP
jgi:hypothetical protein